MKGLAVLTFLLQLQCIKPPALMDNGPDTDLLYIYVMHTNMSYVLYSLLKNEWVDLCYDSAV